jgi:membrane protein
LAAGIAAVGLTSVGFDEAQLRNAGAIAVYADVSALLADFASPPLAR